MGRLAGPRGRRAEALRRGSQATAGTTAHVGLGQYSVVNAIAVSIAACYSGIGNNSRKPGPAPGTGPSVGTDGPSGLSRGWPAPRHRAIARARNASLLE